MTTKSLIRLSFICVVNNWSHGSFPFSAYPRCGRLEIDDLMWPFTSVGLTAVVYCPGNYTGDHFNTCIASDLSLSIISYYFHTNPSLLYNHGLKIIPPLLGCLKNHNVLETNLALLISAIHRISIR